MARILPVLTNPDRRLRAHAVTVDDAARERLRTDGTFDDLIATMRAEDGVGIAAPQVGIGARVIIVLDGKTPRIFINPEVTSRSVRTAVDTEGCLSVPGIIGLVSRSRAVTLRAQDEHGRPVERKCRDLVARIVQHEIDHLDGVLFIDRAIRTAELPNNAPSELRV
ncbi:peptide deformylase [Candidatus Uhrbacteria bacterium]|nr:peptide deformylase [Candidatus Uhrbacteria bacterium]